MVQVQTVTRKNSHARNKFGAPGLLTLVFFVFALLSTSLAAEEPKGIRFKPVEPQFIAALGMGNANSGSGAEHWGIWKQDPGPRGVWLRDFKWLESRHGVAPAGWTFDETGWWVDENGLIMEEPDFPLAAGHYLVTGEREVITMLTVHDAAPDGTKRWELAENARLEDITHLPCRSAKYTPLTPPEMSVTEEHAATCSPINVPLTKFKVPPGSEMPDVPGCKRQDYRVLIVIGLPVDASDV